jgi:hypothetical protein
MGKEGVVHVGDKVINLDQILYAHQDSQTGEVDIYFAVHAGESLKLNGDVATAFWEFYSRYGTSIPPKGPYGWKEPQQ